MVVLEKRSNVNGTHVPDAAYAEAVRIRHLSKRYGSVDAIQDLGFSVPAGQIVGVLGPNGAGKSTTLRVLLGLAMPTTGEALVFGKPFRDLTHPARRVGAVLESDDFDPGRSGRDHLRYLAIVSNLSESRVEDVLALVGLSDHAHRRVRTYSLGMKQRLGLATALLGDPDLLVLDEPMNGLDPSGIYWLRTFLRSLANKGKTVLVSSHNLAEMAQLVDRVLILSDGRLVADVLIEDVETSGQSLEALYLERVGDGT